MSHREMMVETAITTLNALDAEELARVLERVLGEVPPKVRSQVAQVRAQRAGRCCQFFNGYHQQCHGTRRNEGHMHACTGCHDCEPDRFPLCNDDVHRLRNYYDGIDDCWR